MLRTRIYYIFGNKMQKSLEWQTSFSQHSLEKAWALAPENLNMNFDSATCTIPYIKQVTIKDLLYSTANATQYSVMIYKGIES